MKVVLSVFVGLALLSAACGSSDSGGGSSARGTAKKAEDCKVSNDCAEPSAFCVKATKCSGPIDSLAFTTECTAATVGDCAGLSCIVLKANKQNKTGLCTMSCTTDADCGGASLGACVNMSLGLYCLKPCAADADCQNGFVCIPNPADASKKACLAEAS